MVAWYVVVNISHVRIDPGMLMIFGSTDKATNIKTIPDLPFVPYIIGTVGSQASQYIR